MKSTGNSNHSLFLPINVLTVLYCDSNSCLIHLDTYLVCKVSPSANLIPMISYDIHSEIFLNKYLITDKGYTQVINQYTTNYCTQIDHVPQIMCTISG